MYLFICYANRNRSKTAVEVFQSLARQKGIKKETASAGISTLAEQAVTVALLKKAELIFVMEYYMKEQIQNVYDIPAGKIINLNIPDMYERNDPVLVQILREEISKYI